MGVDAIVLALAGIVGLYMAANIGANDLANARELYNNILQSVPANSQLAWEAHSGLSRIYYSLENYDRSMDELNAALAITKDTTDYVEYQIARLEMAMN